MRQILVWRKLAERWREAASEVMQPALKRCYRERAAAYERLANDDHAGKRNKVAKTRGNGGERP